jgi:hypothetical protein
MEHIYIYLYTYIYVYLYICICIYIIYKLVWISEEKWSLHREYAVQRRYCQLNT